MADAHCDFCDLPLAQCPHGNPTATLAEQPTQYRTRYKDCTEGEDGPTIEAHISGECVTCLDPIEPGDWITHLPEGWVHGSPPERSRPPQTDSSMFEGVD